VSLANTEDLLKIPTVGGITRGLLSVGVGLRVSIRCGLLHTEVSRSLRASALMHSTLRTWKSRYREVMLAFLERRPRSQLLTCSIESQGSESDQW
jgi:hypothetical protein